MLMQDIMERLLLLMVVLETNCCDDNCGSGGGVGLVRMLQLMMVGVLV